MREGGYGRIFLECTHGMSQKTNGRDSGKTKCASALPGFGPFLLMTVVRKRYHEIKDEWFGKPEVFDRQDVIEVILAIFLCHLVRLTGLPL